MVYDGIYHHMVFDWQLNTNWSNPVAYSNVTGRQTMSFSCLFELASGRPASLLSVRHVNNYVSSMASELPTLDLSGNCTVVRSQLTCRNMPTASFNAHTMAPGEYGRLELHGNLCFSASHLKHKQRREAMFTTYHKGGVHFEAVNWKQSKHRTGHLLLFAFH